MQFFRSLLVLFLVMASAQAETVTMTVGQALELLPALKSLDGHPQIAKDGERQVVVNVPYSFGIGLRVAIAKNILKLGPIQQAFAVARNARITELSGGKGAVQPNTPEAAKLAADIDAMITEKQDVDLVKINISELKLSDNPIPPSDLAAMMPILVDDGAGGDGTPLARRNHP